MNEPTTEMLDAVALYMDKMYELYRKNLASGACACLGPAPLCKCMRRDLTVKWRIMTAVAEGQTAENAVAAEIQRYWDGISPAVRRELELMGRTHPPAR